VNQYVRFIPNLLSIIRLCLAFVFPFCPERIWIWLIIGGGCSDFLDGYMARKFDVATWQGGLLDAIADKTFILLVFITFAYTGKFSPWWIPAVIARDMIVVLAAGYAVWHRSWASFQEMDARWSGKCATAGQFILLFTVALFPLSVSIVLYMAVAASLIAAADYGIIFSKALRDQ